MLSRFTVPALAAILFAGVSINPAVASPTTAFAPSVGNDAVPVVPNLSVDPMPSSPNRTAAQLPNAAERARLNSAIFAPPAGYFIATDGGAKLDQSKPPLPSLNDGLQSRSRHSSDYDFRYVDPYRNSVYGTLSNDRQNAFDRIADSISPGFGRIEFDSGKNHIRIDYLYSKKCKIRGAGVCFRMSF